MTLCKKNFKALPGFEMEEETERQERKQPLEARKRQEPDSLRAFRKESRPVDPLL